MLAKSKINTIRELYIISKALRDGQIDDKEFSLILKEIDKYETLLAKSDKKLILLKKKRFISEESNLCRSGRRSEKKAWINIYFERNQTSFNLHIERLKRY